MKQIAQSVFSVVMMVGICVAQMPDIRQLELQRAEAVRTGKGLERFYASDYMGINRSGGVTDLKTVAALKADPKYLVNDDIDVRVYGNGAITTGTQHVEDGGIVVRFLRVWVKQPDGWRLVAFQGTAISSDTSSTAAPSSVKTLPRPSPSPTRRVDRAVLAADQSLLRAEAENDDAQNRELKTSDSTFVSRTGSSAARVNDPSRVPLKSEGASYDRVQAYGDIAVVQGALLWTDINGFSPGALRFTRVWVKQGDAWKLAAEQRTPIGS
jgi:hypothetical protein